MKKIFIVCIFVFLIYPIYSQDDNGDLVLKVKIDKTDFFETEPIWVKISLTNIGNENKEVIPIEMVMLKQYLIFNMENSSGESINYGCFVAEFVQTPKHILKSNETIFDYFDLHEFYGKQARSRRSLEKDSYIFWVELHSYGEVLISNKINFAVNMPVGKEEIVRDLFCKGCNTWFSNKEIHKALKIFRSITKEYPNSVYAELSLAHIASIYSVSLFDTEKTILTIEELIEKYPKSYFAVKKLSKLVAAKTRFLNKKQARTEILKLLNISKDIHPDFAKKAKEMAERYR